MGKRLIGWLDLEGRGQSDILYLEAATKWSTTGSCHGTCRVKHLYLSVASSRWQSALSSAVQKTPNWGGPVDYREGKAATRRNPEWLGKQANRNCMKLNMGKSHSCPWEWRAPCRSTGWGLPAALLPRGAWEPSGHPGGQWTEHEPKVCFLHNLVMGAQHIDWGVIIPLSSSLQKPHLSTICSFPAEFSPSFPITLAGNTGKQSGDVRGMGTRLLLQHL